MPIERDTARRLLRTAIENEGSSSSAAACVDDALRLLVDGDVESSVRWSIRSLEHSVGVFSPIYNDALAAAGLHRAFGVGEPAPIIVEVRP